MSIFVVFAPYLDLQMQSLSTFDHGGMINKGVLTRMWALPAQ